MFDNVETFDGCPCCCPISKEQFQCYVDIQKSGVTNMWDIKTVKNISKLKKVPLTDDDCFYIMKNYIALATLYEIY